MKHGSVLKVVLYISTIAKKRKARVCACVNAALQTGCEI